MHYMSYNFSIFPQLFFEGTKLLHGMKFTHFKPLPSPSWAQGSAGERSSAGGRRAAGRPSSGSRRAVIRGGA